MEAQLPMCTCAASTLFSIFEQLFDGSVCMIDVPWVLGFVAKGVNLSPSQGR